MGIVAGSSPQPIFRTPTIIISIVAGKMVASLTLSHLPLLQCSLRSFPRWSLLRAPVRRSTHFGGLAFFFPWHDRREKKASKVPTPCGRARAYDCANAPGRSRGCSGEANATSNAQGLHPSTEWRSFSATPPTSSLNPTHFGPRRVVALSPCGRYAT